MSFINKKNSSEQKRDAIAELHIFVREYFSGIPYNTHHLDHALRVLQTSLKIGQQMGADITILEASALLHDIGRMSDDDTECHAESSARMTEQILSERGWGADDIKAITYAVRCHRYSKGVVPETLEAGILQDADRLDALGAIGIARVLCHDTMTPLYSLDSTEEPFGGNCVAAHFFDKILKLRDTMNTEQGRTLAERRHDVLLDFLKELRLEIYSL